jgi:hypothetical protein
MIYDRTSKAYATEATYDTRRYPYGPPLDAGRKGWEFRLWRENFVARLGTHSLTDNNQASTLQDTAIGFDDGGDRAPPGAAGPLPLVGGGAGAQRRIRRLKMLYSIIHAHLDDPLLVQLIETEAYQNGREAMQILDRECDEPINDLVLQDMLRNVRELSILGSTGYHESSVSKFRLCLNYENSKIPDPALRVPEGELAQIMLKQLGNASANLAAEADKEPW